MKKKNKTLPEKLTLENLSEMIDAFPKKHKHGFLRVEIESMLDRYSLDKKKVYTEIGVNTCMMIDGESVTFDNDVELGIRCVLRGRSKSAFEWD